jgi:tetratricopeptide (TPR) repeat protein
MDKHIKKDVGKLGIEEMEEAMKLYNDGREALSSGHRNLAIQKFRQSYSLAPHYKTFELLGEALMAEGEYIEAVVYLAAAAGIGEKQFKSRYLLARALLALGDVWKDDAIEQLRKSIELNPNYRTAKKLLAELSHESKDT